MAITDALQKFSVLVPVLLALVGPLPVRAATQAMTLKEVVETSLRQNGELAAGREEKGIREAGAARAVLLPNPTLELDAATGALTGSTEENSLSLGLSQEFLLGGKRDKRLAVAQRELEAYDWQLADRQRLLVQEVKGSFYDLLLAQQRAALNLRSRSLAGQLLEVTRERLAAGDIPELEMNLAKVEVARAEAAGIEAQRALIQHRSRLLTLMGTRAGSDLEISGKLDAPAPPVQSLPELKELALKRRPDLLALRAEKGRGDADLTLARAEGIPNLTAGITLNRDTTTMEIGSLQGKDTAYTVGIKLSMPLPVFDRNRPGVQEARARLSSSESRLAAAALTVDREVAAAYAGYLSSEQVLALYRGNILPQLEENLSLVQEAYRLGEIGILEVVQEQKKFSEVNDGYLTALYERQAALARLESAVASELTGGVQ